MPSERRNQTLRGVRPRARMSSENEVSFEKFFSTPRPSGKKGTGLGLAFVREIAQLHGGQARLVNHADGGALATISLPRHTDD